MLSVVTFKWKSAARYRSTFTAESVNVLKRMTDRHYAPEHRFICFTDDAKGLDEGIEAHPLWNDYASIPSPNGGHNPSCYRRLKMFSKEIEAIVGPRFVCLDLDTVITGDLASLWDRPEDFVAWEEQNPKNYYNGSMWLLKTGTRPKVWEDFSKASAAEAFRAGHFGSDQSWMSYKLGPHEAKWTTADGVYSYNSHLRGKTNTLPANATAVMFHGKLDPWLPEAMAIPWVKAHYR